MKEATSRLGQVSGNRAVELYLIRHGEAESQEKDAKLSEKGRLQAAEAATLLFTEISAQGSGLLKIVHSPTPRAKETFDIMMEVITGNVGSRDPRLRVCRPHVASALEAGGVIGPLMKRGIPYEETVEYWLSNPETVEGRSPFVIAERSRKVIRRLKKMADRLPSGVKIFYVGITHEIPQAALLLKASGKKLSELGGSIENCERIRIDVGTGSTEQPRLYFRGFQMDLPV